MWPFSRKPPVTPQQTPQEWAVLYCSKKWNFFLESHEFLDDFPLACKIGVFTARMRLTLAESDRRLGKPSEADLERYVFAGIIQSGLQTREELEQALGHALPET